MCKILKVSRSGYYTWCNRPESKRSKENKELVKNIRIVHLESRQVYGSPRVYHTLKSKGISCGKNRIARLMRENNIFSRTKKKFKATTNSKHNYPVAANLLNQDFQATASNQKWVADITYIPTKEGWLYLAAVLDLYNKKIVGWAMDSTMTQQLVAKALKQAISREKPLPGLIHHSDRGCQYASRDYQKLLKKYGIIASMSRKGNCYDNACMESFFGSLKMELVHFNSFRTRSEARQSVFEYIEIFYNRKRLHSALGYKTPISYENERKLAV